MPLPESVRATLLNLDRTQQGISWSAPEQWHVTIHFFEDIDIEKVKSLFFGMKAQRAVAIIGPEVRRLGEEVLVVPVNGLSVLEEDVRVAIPIQRSNESLPFFGHITLGRIKQTLTVDREGKRVEGSFKVDRLLLVESQVTPSGHKHSVVGSQLLS